VFPISSKIDNDLALRQGATDEHIAFRRWIDWVRLVGDRPGHKPGFTSVADPRAARPARGDVACLSKLKKTPKRRIPMNVQVAPGERNQRSSTGRPSRHVWRPVRRGSDAWGNGGTGSEKLSMDPAFSNTPGGKARGQVSYEGRWPADEEVSLERHFKFPEGLNVQTPRSVEIDTWPIVAIGRAVAYVTVAAGQGFKEGAGFLGKRMLTPAAGSV
jgi:hypothetical protein